MRVEDLDGPRVKPGAASAALDTLAWLGLDWDGEILTQSEDLTPYRQAMRRLESRDLIYACDLSRQAIRQAHSAPHRGEHDVPYPAAWRPTSLADQRFTGGATNYRLAVPEETIEVEDQFAGPRVYRPIDEVGDFIIWTKQDLPAYQLAVVVDDQRQRVTDVVRGDDLLPSAARQILLYRALGAEPPRWWHLPLVLGEDGRRLAKRHGDTRLGSYRDSGVGNERIIGLLAWWSGASERREACSLDAFRQRFSLERMSRDPITMTEDDHQWLLGAH